MPDTDKEVFVSQANAEHFLLLCAEETKNTTG